MALTPTAVRRRVFRHRSIVAGYSWSMRIVFPNFSIPLGAVIIATMKADPDQPDTLGQLTTANGSIVRVDEHTLDITIAGDVSKDWEEGACHFDFVMPATATYLGVRCEVPVRRPITELP